MAVDVVRRIIAAAMDLHGVTVEAIPVEVPFSRPLLRNRGSPIKDSERYFLLKDIAQFDHRFEEDHDGCDHTWISHNVWCVIDLKEQDIVYRGSQKCNECGKWVTAYFGGSHRGKNVVLKRLAKWAVQEYYRRIGKPLDDQGFRKPRPRRRDKPHEEDKCSECQYWGERCC